MTRAAELTAGFRETIAGDRQRTVELLAEVTAIASGSEMVDGVNRVVDRFAAELVALGLRTTRHPVVGFGDHLVAENDVPGPPVVIGGHLDTTYTDYGPLPDFTIDGKWAIGPGTADMRGGVAVAICALRCLERAGLLRQLPLTVLLNADEERGAATSRQLFLDAARSCRCALFFECAGPAGEVVVGRRAKLSYRLDVKGRGHHAGDKGIDKVSALVELSHKIIAVEALDDPASGASFNVGRAWGGIASNTVPEAATALIDIRYPGSEQEAPIRQAIDQIAASATVPGATAELRETSFRPAWPRGAAAEALFARTQSLAGELDQQLRPEERGGTSDANWFGATGVACLDGLGPVGFHDHTPEERIVLETLFERALLVALLLADLAAGEDEGG